MSKSSSPLPPAERLGSEVLTNQTQKLSNQLYGKGKKKTTKTDKAIAAILEEVRRIRATRGSKDDNDLKPMYPV